jgi:flagellar basal-body rod protein FlgF
MNKGIYIALSGAIQKARHMDVFAQNIANANTSGFKRGTLSFKDHMVPTDNPNNVESKARVMTEKSQEIIDFSNGTQRKTGNPLDVAISGEGFFVLEGNRYTRNGNFHMDNEGNLLDSNGIKVLGDGGNLTLSGSKIDITSTGEVIVDDISVGKLGIVNFTDKSVLRKTDGGFFISDEEGEEVDAVISQGYLEESNVNVVRELVEMIRSEREFESYQKMIRIFDDAAGMSIRDL